jgi:hypothetical protein
VPTWADHEFAVTKKIFLNGKFKNSTGSVSLLLFTSVNSVLMVRIPTKPATHSNLKPATYSNAKPAGIPI